MKTRYIQHKNANLKLLLEIIKVKSVAWSYTVEEHLEWINSNICDEDIHVLLVNDNEEIIAYLNLISIKLSLNDTVYRAYGVGNVCVLERGKGNGARLIKTTNNFLIEKQMIGLLFCKERLVSFYERLNWITIPKSKAYIKEAIPDINTLLFNFKSKILKIEYNNKLF